ncbi:hypothetical protein HaLaN_32748, partial [Haematococcus lacustris]
MALDAKQAGGVSHIANPHHVRGRPWGEASAACAALRNKRVDMKTVGPRDKAELAALKGQLAKQRAAAGLDNDLPNSFANALLQVIPDAVT